ncbi:MAG TPA: deoxyguanosinetriphosphate triphosphohydrolase [Gemmatales bacterium]|nr:deoxyguanosinetriphosphate triphosphohydrolase [Gemmatales bacterium]
MKAYERELGLAPYAMRESQTKGRQYSDTEHPYRGLYQRDRDRILHSSAFRRLTAKTQVLVSGTNDHHRTRLTHTLEVAQVSRTVARELRLNEDLTEAIALVHDIGHPPFGHAGESALDECMKEEGGFEHNRQGLRIVEKLEQRYPSFPGINLTWEVRESLAFHSKRPDSDEVRPYRVGIQQPTLEAQVVDAVDSMVYDVHDLDDALGVGLINIRDLRANSFWREAESTVVSQHGIMAENRLISSVLRFILSSRERELLRSSMERIRITGVESVDQVRSHREPLVHENAIQSEMISEMRLFLLGNVYQHPKVLKMSDRGRHTVSSLFMKYRETPSFLPDFHAERAKGESIVQVVGDYVAGMTDRLAKHEYRKLFQSNEKSDMIRTLS